MINNSLDKLPALVKSITYHCYAWIIDKGAEPGANFDHINQWSIIVPWIHWPTISTLIKSRDVRLIGNGGIMFMDGEGETLSLWPGDVGELMTGEMTRAAWHPRSGRRWVRYEGAAPAAVQSAESPVSLVKEAVPGSPLPLKRWWVQTVTIFPLIRSKSKEILYTISASRNGEVHSAFIVEAIGWREATEVVNKAWGELIMGNILCQLVDCNFQPDPVLFPMTDELYLTIGNLT